MHAIETKAKREARPLGEGWRRSAATHISLAVALAAALLAGRPAVAVGQIVPSASSVFMTNFKNCFHDHIRSEIGSFTFRDLEWAEDEFWRSVAPKSTRRLVDECVPSGTRRGSTRKEVLDDLLVNAVRYGPDPEIIRTLIDAGADVNANLGSGPTPLHYAAKSGSMAVVRFLLRSGAVVDASDGGQLTPFYYAVDGNRPAIAATLFRAGADPRVKGKNGKTALHRAAGNGSLKLVSFLLRNGADPNASYPDHGSDHTPLDRALLRGGRDEIVAALIKAGADPVRPLHRAVEGNDTAVAATLIKVGADVNARREDGWTPLHIATRAGLTELVRLLVQRGAEVDRQDSEGSTPLHIAARFSSPETAEVLIEGGAKVNITNMAGKTPLDVAIASTGERQSAISNLFRSHGGKCATTCN